MMKVAEKRSHSNAPNTVAAWLALQLLPLLHPQSVNKTARAMNPANQKIIVRNSAARMPNLCAAVGKRAGAMVRYATASRVHTAVNRRKFASAGDQVPHGPFQLDTT